MDNCNFAAQTLWSSEAAQYSRTFVLEGTALEIEPGAYDCVIASHCLEHIANPIKALMSGSAFFAGKVFCCSSFLIATIDEWRRPVTTLDRSTTPS